MAEQSKFIKNVQKYNCKHVEERIKADNSIINQLYAEHPETSQISNAFKSSIPQNNNYINGYELCQKSQYETSLSSQLDFTTQILPHNLEIPDQRHIHQDSLNECSGN